MEEMIAEEEKTFHVEEEEMNPMNFAHLLLSFGDEFRTPATSAWRRLRRKLLNMTRIRKGLTAGSCAVDHVMPKLARDVHRDGIAWLDAGYIT